MDSQPSKSDIEAVFHRLRGVSTNKTCFDCNQKNPTWSSVTYGVFICLDCSAVHRSLGVHLTFVRSTQLDTNWTWQQLRQMQLGGNANANQFFSQHNCQTNDAQKKYNSRAAQLYRDKLQSMAANAIKNNNQLHIQAYQEEKQEEKEVDFFEEHENFSNLEARPRDVLESISMKPEPMAQSLDPSEGPKVDFSAPVSMDKNKSTIGVRKVQPKRTGLGAKKGGLGATKVKTNFAEIEREAEMAEESKMRMQQESEKQAALTVQEKMERDAAARLVYKEMSDSQDKMREQVKKGDPKKAEQLERLGMGMNSRTGISHSVLTDMQTIEQENVQSSSSVSQSLAKLRLAENDFFDDYSLGGGFSMNRNSSFGSSSASRDRERDNYMSENSWVVVDDPVSSEKPKGGYKSDRNAEKPVPRSSSSNFQSSNASSSSDSAQKKFGNAKAISSDQFFNDRGNDYETQSNLNRFQGSSSISSSDFFGNGKESDRQMSSMQALDIDDVRESVRQGVTKVAGKLSSLANGVMSSLQDRYGY